MASLHKNNILQILYQSSLLFMTPEKISYMPGQTVTVLFGLDNNNLISRNRRPHEEDKTS